MPTKIEQPTRTNSRDAIMKLDIKRSMKLILALLGCALAPTVWAA